LASDEPLGASPKQHTSSRSVSASRRLSRKLKCSVPNKTARFNLAEPRQEDASLKSTAEERTQRTGENAEWQFEKGQIAREKVMQQGCTATDRVLTDAPMVRRPSDDEHREQLGAEQHANSKSKNGEGQLEQVQTVSAKLVQQTVVAIAPAFSDATVALDIVADKRVEEDQVAVVSVPQDSAAPEFESTAKCAVLEHSQRQVGRESREGKSAVFTETPVVRAHYWREQEQVARPTLFASCLPKRQEQAPITKDTRHIEDQVVRDHYWGFDPAPISRRWCLPTLPLGRGRWTRPQAGTGSPPHAAAVVRVQNTFITVDEVSESAHSTRLSRSVSPSIRRDVEWDADPWYR